MKRINHSAKPAPPDICVLIPAYNEARSIGDIVGRAKKYARKVLVVDDGSTDGTSLLARQAGGEVLRHEVNQGKGASLREGFERIFSEGWAWLIVLDGDGQHEPEEIPNFIRIAEESGAAIVVGNRMEDVRNMPAVRYNTNWLTSTVVSWLAGQKVPDSQCGYRLIRKEIFDRVQCTTRNYDTESEMLIEAGRRGFKIASAPIKSIYSHQMSKIHPVKDSWRFIRLVLRSLLPGRKSSCSFL